MSNDTQFTATGPATVGFQTSDDTIDLGANIAGKSGGYFRATGSGPQVAAIGGDSPYGRGFIAGNDKQDDDPSTSDQPVGVYGESLVPGGIGVEAYGDKIGVHAQIPNLLPLGQLAVRDGPFNQYTGVYGASDHQGVVGESLGPTGAGVVGMAGQQGTQQNPATGGTGVLGTGYIGVRGETTTGVAVLGRLFGPGVAGRFEGDVQVTGDVEVLGDIRLVNQDVAEEFDIRDGADVEPGTVMVFDSDGKLSPCRLPYDTKVAGVIAAAGACRPAIVLGRMPSSEARLPIALVGKTYCRVHAGRERIDVGDLLTTSDLPGYAMKASDPARAFGAVIGKALRRLDSGTALIPILVALQ
jgi:hypothetical protein